MKYIIYIFCKYCNKSYAYPSSIEKDENGNTIRSISRHLINCISYNIKKKKIKVFDFAARMKMSKTILDDYNNDSMIDKILKFFISGNIIFNQVNNSYFQVFICYTKMRVKDSKIN